MKHTPTAEQIRTLKITMEEEIDRNGDEYEDVNENCRYWLNNINDIVHAVNMHESLINTLKADLRVFKSLAEESNDAAIRRSIFDIEEILSQAERK